MSRPFHALREEVRRTTENRPGVYRMVAPGGTVVYVGKSVRVRSRLLSYFRAGPGEKPFEILATTARIEWDPVPSEFAALLLEMRLIRRWRPSYNVEHNRRLGFSFVRVTREPAPRLQVTPAAKADGCRYYGPFRGRKGVRNAVRELVDVLGLRDCSSRVPTRYSDQGDLFPSPLVPLCMRGELRRCVAPCARSCSEADYQRRVDVACAFLEGREDAPLRTLEGRMRRAADRCHFEHAALLRDRLDRLARLRAQLRMLWREMDELSVAYRIPGHDGEDRVYLLRRGLLVEEHPAPRDRAEERRLRDRIERAARVRRVPLHSLPAERLSELLLVLRWFRSRPEELDRTEPLASRAKDALHGTRRRSA